MVQLNKSLQAVESDSFNKILKSELATFDNSEFPLHIATTQGGIIDDRPISVSVLSKTVEEQEIHVKLGVFFDEVVGGCSCGDPPMTVNDYCELLLKIDKKTAKADFIVLSDD